MMARAVEGLRARNGPAWMAYEGGVETPFSLNEAHGEVAQPQHDPQLMERNTRIASGYDPDHSVPSHTIIVCGTDQPGGGPLVQCLRKENFEVFHATSGGGAIMRILAEAPDLVLLDAGPASMSGYEVCRAIRPDYNGLIIFYSPENEETAQLLAFEVGADDYIIKPQSPRILAARLRAHLLRPHLPGKHDPRKTTTIGALFVDASRREARMRNEPLDLTTAQFDVVWYLAKRAGRVVSREELYDALFNADYDGVDRTLDVHISRIRQKMGDSAESPKYLKTIRGVGYMMAKA